jgi:hypothetical protein
MLRRLGELFRPADQAGIAAAAPQRNGILLLLSALALGVLVVAGSSLWRLLDRMRTELSEGPA